MRPQLATVTFKDLNKLDIPVILFLDRHDYTTPSSIAAAWMERLKAPKKVAVWFENSAHLHILEEPVTFSPPFLEHVRPLPEKSQATHH
jgi:proline iminopeptidase